MLNDQQDSISQRDTGWIQIYARNNQEILDSVIQAYKIAESVYVPVMVCYDGYILSHTEMPVDLPSQEDVDRFLPPYKPHTILDPANPRELQPCDLCQSQSQRRRRALPRIHGTAVSSPGGAAELQRNDNQGGSRIR